MNGKELTEQMINLQQRMDGLREIEKTAFERKLKAKVQLESHPAYAEIICCERECKDAVATWYKLYTEYLNLREELNAIK